MKYGLNMELKNDIVLPINFHLYALTLFHQNKQASHSLAFDKKNPSYIFYLPYSLIKKPLPLLHGAFAAALP